MISMIIDAPAAVAELMLGISGMAIAIIAVVLAINVLRFLPVSLEDKLVDPHAQAREAKT